MAADDNVDTEPFDPFDPVDSSIKSLPPKPVERRLREELKRERAKVQFLIDKWPGKMEDGGMTFPDGEFVPRSPGK